MTTHIRFKLAKAAVLVLLTGFGLTGCTAKEEVQPDSGGCSTLATVRLCYGNTTMCHTGHTSLVLSDGTRLRPSGPLWAAYLSQQQDGQVLRIGYQVLPRPANAEDGLEYVSLTCLGQNEPKTCGFN